MILFLDFDGVLHPEYDGQPAPSDQAFCHLLRLEQVLREFPDVEVVISSMWRYEFSIEQLREHFSSDIAARIIGVTPLSVREGKYLEARREAEILEWLHTNRPGANWVALDDAVWQFHSHLQRVVGCMGAVGFDEVAERSLREMLEKASPE